MPHRPAGTCIIRSSMPDRPQCVSAPGRSVVTGSWLGGLLRHAGSGRVQHANHQWLQTLPRNYMAPDHVVWAYDNRAAMVRVIGTAAIRPRDSKTGWVNRRQIRISTWPHRSPPDWMVWRPAPIRTVGRAPTVPMRQPCRGLCWRQSRRWDSACFRAAFGDAFVDYFLRLKEFEIGRFLSDVTDWEQREYFAIL